MFGSGKIRELEAQLSSMRSKLDSAEKEKKDALQQLTGAKSRIQELEQQLAESEGTELKAQARKTIVEYEGLKDLYMKKNREIDESRESVEESFAREAATKRHDLEEEIRTNREDNQTMVSETVKTFAGSYQYYLDQIRVLMDALSQAARETGDSLFAGDPLNIREVFGSRIREHLQNDTDALKQNAGDLLLIGAEEAKEAVGEVPAEEAAAEVAEAAEEIAPEAAEEAAETTEEIAGAAEEAAEAAEDAAEEVAEEATEEIAGAAEEAAEAAEDAVEEIAADATEEIAGAAEEAAEAVEEAAEEAVEAAEDAAEEAAEEIPEAIGEKAEEAAETVGDAQEAFAEAAEEIAEAAEEIAEDGQEAVLETAETVAEALRGEEE